MNTPVTISRIITITSDSLDNPSADESVDGVSILYFDQNEDLILSLNTDYSDTIQIFFMCAKFLSLSQLLPFVKTTKIHPDSKFEHIICVVPSGKNFFEEDFTGFNEYFGLSKTKDFKFSM